MENFIKDRFATVLAILFLLSATGGINAQVRNSKELQEALLKAKPGEVIHLDDGIYSGETLRLPNMGSATKPITIKAKNLLKAVVTCPVKIEGDFLTIEGLAFKEQGSVEVSGNNCKILRCSFNDVKAGKWIRVMPGNSQVEIAYCLFENKTNNRELDRNCQLIQIVVRNQDERHHLHHNLFRDIPEGKTGNGFETLQLITENNPFNPKPGLCNTIIESNLFVRCNGESEIISVKSNGNLLRRNTFRESKGSLVLRHGHHNVVVANYFFGDGEKGSGGVRIQGKGQMVISNYFQDLHQLGLGMMDGTPDDLYVRVENAYILFNTFVNCKKNFVIGLNHSLHPNGTSPKDCLIAGNIFYYNTTDKPTSFIEFVQGDEPENWTWEGNFYVGAPAPDNIPGLTQKNPELLFQPGTPALPTHKTPVVNVSFELTGDVQADMAGKKWNPERSAGAFQYPVGTATTFCLDENMVGPFANQSLE